MQNALCAEIDQSSRNGAGKGKKNKVAVDAVFFQRISTILGMCVKHTYIQTHLCCVVEVWWLLVPLCAHTEAVACAAQLRAGGDVKGGRAHPFPGRPADFADISDWCVACPCCLYLLAGLASQADVAE